MSINVTVTGNPIKIHRGKLIQSSSTTDAEDVDKRRKMRLQQVRQQSKELAAKVRNNVKKVRNKQQSDFEAKNQTKLKEWQNKKLLQLQNVYEDNVNEIGLGHTQAHIDEMEEIQEMERQKLINDAKASRRGAAAQELLQVQKNEESLQKAIPRQAKQIAREVENARAAMVAKQGLPSIKTKTTLVRNKKVTKGSFVIVEDDEENVPDKNDIDYDKVLESDRNKSPKLSPVRTTNHGVGLQTLTSIESYNKDEIYSKTNLEKSPTKRFRHEEISHVSMVSLDVPPETRISDRIRSRHLVSAAISDIPESDSDISSHELHRVPDNKENRDLNVQINIHRDKSKFSSSTQPGVSIPPTLQSDVITCPMCVKDSYPKTGSCSHYSHTSNRRVCPPPSPQTECLSTKQVGEAFEVPCKPTVRLAKESYVPQYSKHDVETKEYRQVRSFDRNNRFGHHYVTDTTHVHRVRDDELEYSDLEGVPGPSDGHRHSRSHSNSHQHQHQRHEFSKMADERAKMADIRGRRAIEKENIHKDYEELMKKLPILQKQGRIANLSVTKGKLHMSDARKKEHEKERQEKMERAFEVIAPKITLPRANTTTNTTSSPTKHKSAKKSPKKAAATWKSTKTGAKKDDKGGKHTTVQDNEKADDCEGATCAGSPETNNLLSLLEKLRSQKKELLKECKDLPRDSNFYNFIDDLEFVARSQPSQSNCQGNSRTNVQKNSDKNIQTETVSDLTKQNNGRKDSSSKIHKQVLVLQNTSTQTSPKVSASSNEGSDHNIGEPPAKQSKTVQANAKHAKGDKPDKSICSCKDRDKLCEILIKIRDCPAHSVEAVSSKGSSSHSNDDKGSSRGRDVQLSLESGDVKVRNKKKHEKKVVKELDGSDSSLSSCTSPCPKRSRSESPKKLVRKHDKNVKDVKVGNESTSKDNNLSWRQELSSSSVRNKNAGVGTDIDRTDRSTRYRNKDDITSSTSYYSPPDYSAKQNNVESAPKTTETRVLGEKPKLDNNLIGYISKMLQISKGNLNQLAANVSSVSDVPTPSSSVINMRSNKVRPQRLNVNHNDSSQIEKLSTVLKFFNLTPGDFHSFVSLQSSAPRTRSNSLESQNSRLTHNSQKSSTSSNCNLDCHTRSPTPTDMNTGSGIQTGSGTTQSKTYRDEFDGCGTQPVTDQFAQWAQICQARINNLTEMIDKVRMEKQEMIQGQSQGQSPHEDKSLEKSNNVTSYMNLPPGSSTSSPVSPSWEQKKLNEMLITNRDFDASKAGTSTQNKNSEVRSRHDLDKLLELSKTHPEIDKDMIERYMKLIDVELQAQRAKSPVGGGQKIINQVAVKSPDKNVTFKPMLDIPKLPKFSQPSLHGQDNMASTSNTHAHKNRKPPVTNNALRFNDVIHELSAIPEAENSRLSKSPVSKTSSPQKKMCGTPNQHKLGSGGQDGQVLMKPCENTSTKQVANDLSSGSDKSGSNNSKCETVESMLKNIGLDWAINTLKVMNAANTNNSSSSTSSSFDIEQKKMSFTLGKNMSTSTEKDLSMSKLQRTSTPVHTTNSSKSQPSQRLIHSGESEVSPVGNSGQPGRRTKHRGLDCSDATFRTLPSPSVQEESDS